VSGSPATLDGDTYRKGGGSRPALAGGIKANEPETYPNLISIVQAVADGEVDVGFVNHYYVPLIAEEGEDFGACNYYLGMATLARWSTWLVSPSPSPLA
jgi:hypothetical protein